jgi:hypothetical protein
MVSTVRINKLVEGLEVIVEVSGKPVRAVVTREALEVLWKAKITRPDDLLDSYLQHKNAIEGAIIDRYGRDKKQPVVLHAMP